MARKAVPLRLDPALIAEIDEAAKVAQTPRTYLIEDAIKAHLHRLKGYAAMDKGPPKKAKRVAFSAPTAVTLAEPLKARSPGKTFKVQVGWDAITGDPIYAGGGK